MGMRLSPKPTSAAHVADREAKDTSLIYDLDEWRARCERPLPPL